MNDKKSFIEQGNETEDWIDVLKNATTRAVDKVNVATLAFVEEEIDTTNDKYDIVTVSPFPLEQGQKEYTIRAYCPKDFSVRRNKKDVSIKKGDIVVVLFINKDFRYNLEYDEPQQSSSEDYHPITCGVIVNILYSSKGE